MKTYKSPKYTQLLNAGMSLIQKFGIRKITVEEICKEANVSKMTFYKFFDNKQDFVDHLWEAKFDQGWKQFDEIEAMDIPFLQKVRKILELKEANTKEFGPEFVKEYSELVPEFLEKYAMQYEVGMKRFIDFIKDHQKRGEVRDSMRPDFFLRVIGKLMELTQDQEFIESYPSLKDFALEINNFLFYGIMPVPDDTKKNDIGETHEN